MVTLQLPADASTPWGEKTREAFRTLADPLNARLSRAGQALAARPRNTKMSKDKAKVSVTLNTFDGWDFTGSPIKIDDMQALAECNWRPEHIYKVPTYLWKCIQTGPWHQGATTAQGSFLKPFDFTTMVEGDFFSVGNSYVTGIWAPHVRIWVDDEEIQEWYLGARSGGTLQSNSQIDPSPLGAGTHVFNINFAERGIYKVRVAGLLNTVGGSEALSGNLITMKANQKIFKPEARPVAAVISDSWFESLISQTALSVAHEVSSQTGLNIFNCAQGGSGMVNPSESGANGDKSYKSDLVFAALARVPNKDLIIVNGTCNDLGYTEAQTVAAMKALFDRIRSDIAQDMPIYWIGLEPQSYFKNVYGLAAIKTREEALRQVAAADPNVIGYALPALEEWLTGTGNTSSPAGNGNQDVMIGADAVHNSRYGAKFYGRMIGERMRSVA